jgi:UDP-N-acetylmuramoyl-L-alanyl-D-glutamate--2,6-diaminopimelate ligase
MTSEGARQHRHRGIALDALVFTNLAPEHIESHGSFENYAAAKYELGLHLVRSSKRPRIMVANADDAQGARFLTLPVEHALPFSLASDTTHEATDRSGHFHFGESDIVVHQPGEFSLHNALAAATVCRALGIDEAAIARGIGAITHIPGRAERIEEGQNFTVIVDYAHTPDSLEAIYRAYSMPKIAVLGSMGGSRDGWNRPEKARIAAEQCRHVILTNEDSCDDDPRAIITEMERGIPTGRSYEVILDRREAIRTALHAARAGDVVIITGKGTDPWIYGARGARIPWSDAGVVREELHTLLAGHA